MKQIVETTGSFQLMGSLMNGADSVPFNRPAVVQATTFIQLAAGRGQLKVYKTDLPDTADDVEFAKHWAEAKGDIELAIESYISTLPADAPEVEEKPKGRKTKEA